MNWGDLFDRQPAEMDVTRADIRSTLAHRRSSSRGDEDHSSSSDRDDGATASTSDPDPSIARIVADADVLAADLLIDGSARAALDLIRGHSWLTLVATRPLLADAEAIIADLAGVDLASAWRSLVTDRFVVVEQPPGDHPALAAAYHGGAMHVLSFDPDLTGVAAGMALRDRTPMSVREPQAFTVVFDPERVYPTIVDGEYSGPDRDPRE